MTTATAIDDTITIETADAAPVEVSASATLTPAARRADPGDVEMTDGVAAAAALVEAPKVEAPAPATRSEFEQKVDELDPPLPNETAEQRTVRMSRGEKRILGLLSRTKSTEDALKTATDEIARLKAAPAGTAPAAEAPAAAPVPPKVELPKFEFPNWDTYSEEHPEASHEDYIDARQDARDLHKKDVARIETEAADRERVARAEADGFKKLEGDTHLRIETFKTQTPDYADVMKSAMDLPLPEAMHAAMLTSEIGPAIAYHLARNRDEHLRIVSLPAARQIVEIGKIESKLEAGQAPAPAAADPAAPAPAAAAPAARPTVTPPTAAPSRPLSDAPAPVGDIPGGAQPTKSLEALAADGEDADAYIAERQRQRKAIGLRR